MVIVSISQASSHHEAAYRGPQSVPSDMQMASVRYVIELCGYDTTL